MVGLTGAQLYRMIESGQDDEIQNHFEHKIQWGKLFEFKVIKKNDNDGLLEADTRTLRFDLLISFCGSPPGGGAVLSMAGRQV